MIADNLKLHWEIAILGTISAAGGGSKNVANVFHFRRTTTAVEADKSAIATAFDASYGPTIVAALNARVNLSQVTVRCINDVEDAAHSLSINRNGAIAGESLPLYCVATIRMNTNSRGKWARGRKHFGPMSEADTTGDVFTGDGLTRLQTLRNKLDDSFTDSTGNTFVPCIVSKTYSQLETNPTTVFAYDVTACVLNVSVGTLNRRKVRTVN